MNAKQLIRMLESGGWVIKAQKGSHKQFVHPDRPGKITIADHGKKAIPVGTLNSILKQTGLK